MLAGLLVCPPPHGRRASTFLRGDPKFSKGFRPRAQYAGFLSVGDGEWAGSGKLSGVCALAPVADLTDRRLLEDGEALTSTQLATDKSGLRSLGSCDQNIAIDNRSPLKPQGRLFVRIQRSVPLR